MSLSAPMLSLYVRETSAWSPSLTQASCISIVACARASVNAMETTEGLTAPGAEALDAGSTTSVGLLASPVTIA